MPTECNHFESYEKFFFRSIYGIMNTSGLWHGNVNFAKDPKYSWFHKQIKIECITYIYILL